MENSIKRIRLVSLDLDGTLLNNVSKISDTNRLIVEKALKAGIEVVINTGRPYEGPVQTFLKQLKLNSVRHYSITYNGAQVAENTGKILFQDFLTYAEVLQIAKMAKALEVPVDFITADDYYTLEDERPSLTHLINNTAVFTKVRLSELPKNKAYFKAILSAKPRKLNEILTRLPAELLRAFEVVKTCDILIEIMPKNVTKGNALQALCDYLNILPSEVLAMGDGRNDISMLEWAGLGLAPLNADRAVKESADDVLDYTNEENAVAEAIQRFVL